MLGRDLRQFLVRLGYLLATIVLPCVHSHALELPQDGDHSWGSSSIESGAEKSESVGEVDEKAIRFQFADAPWPKVLKWLAEHADLTLDMSDVPEGSFHYINDRGHSVREAIEVMNGYLLPRGYVLLRRDGFLVSMKTENPVLQNLIPSVAAEDLSRYADNELLRVIVKVEGVDHEEVAQQLSQVLGAKGHAKPLSASDSIVLQGFGKSLREAVDILNSAVVPPADDELVFRSFVLEHVPAADAERQIQNLFGLGSNPFQASMARRSSWNRRRSRGRDDDDDRQQTAPTPLVENLALNMKVSALRHTNSLLVTATPAAISLLEDILKTIDVPPSDDEGSLFTSNTPELRVYTVTEADEDDVAATIDAVLPGVVINEDGRHNAIHVFATPLEHHEVGELIEIIDGGDGGGGVEVVQLTRTDALTMSDMLSSLFRNEDRDDRPVITPDFRNNSLIIRATSGQMAEIRKTLLSFGERPGASLLSSGNSRFRRLSLQNHEDAERMARLVQELLSDDRQFDNPIRVVVPSAGQPPESSRRAQDEPDSVPSDRVKVSSRGTQSGQSVTVMPLSATAQHSRGGRLIAAQFAGRQAAGSESSPSDTPLRPQSAPRVTIEIRGGELFLYSNDATALDEVEETIRELARQMPSRKEWTIFYLRAAPAEGTAQTLVSLLQGQSYPAPLVGVESELAASGIGPQPMRIVPDARTNALFVSGPQEQVEQAENFLRYLDTTELPESLRDRVPRAITLEYADAAAVAAMVRELYKDFMQDPNARARQGRGNNRGGGDDEEEETRVIVTPAQNPGLQPTGIQLTVAVDAQSNTLLVSCNDQLYQQILTLVRERDLAARETSPVVEVIPADQGLLRSLLPTD